MPRTTNQVFEDHLALARAGEVEADIQRNFAPDCVLLTTDGEFQGHEGVRMAAAALARQLPDASFEYTTRMVSGELAFLEWTGDSQKAHVRDGADSFVVQNGRIRYMTAHYTVERK